MRNKLKLFIFQRNNLGEGMQYNLEIRDAKHLHTGNLSL